MTTLILKPTDGCNARCRYCSAAHPGAARIMTLATLREVFRLFGDWALRQRRPHLRIIWHGGEPLLMPSTFWEGVFEAQDALLASRGLDVSHAIQTNATLVEAGTIPLLQRLLGSQGVVGTSLDPTPDIRELKGSPGGEYARRWEEGIGRLRKAGIRYGLVFVVHRLVLPQLSGLYWMLRSRHAGAGIRFNPLYRQGRAASHWEDLGITAGQWGEALTTLHAAWEEDGRPAGVLPFAPWAELHGAKAWRLSCECSGTCVADHFGVDPDGEVHLCGRSVDGGAFRFGPAAVLSADGLARHPLRRTLANRRAFLARTACGGCPWWAYCHGGCVNDALLDHGSPFARTSYCEGLKAFFSRAYGAVPEAS